MVIFIYAVPPGVPEIETSDPLKEGDHITCRSNGGRPSPQLDMFIHDELVPSDMLPMNGSYHVIRSAPVNRTWNRQTVECLFRNEFYNGTNRKFLNVKCKFVYLIPMLLSICLFCVINSLKHNAIVLVLKYNVFIKPEATYTATVKICINFQIPQNILWCTKSNRKKDKQLLNAR